MSNKWKKILFTTHGTGLLLCLALLFGIRQQDHLRWNLANNAHKDEVERLRKAVRKKMLLRPGQ